MVKHPYWKELFDWHIRQMTMLVKQLPMHEYILIKGKIGYKTHDTVSTKIYHGYLTNFAYFQEKDRNNVSQETLDATIGFNIPCGRFSYAEVPPIYENVLGVTGTLKL
jgi:hypothetical protein